MFRLEKHVLINTKYSKHRMKDDVLEIFGPFELVGFANNDFRWRG